MNIELLEEEIKQKKIEMLATDEYISKTQQEIAEYSCPFTIGQRVASEGGEEVIIASISYRCWGRDKYDFKVFRMKKDGTPYKQSQYAYGQAYKAVNQ